MCIWNHDSLPGSNNQYYLRRLFSLVCLFLVCFLPLALISCQEGNAATTGLIVTMTDNPMGMNGTFSPRELQITAGQTVTWINQGRIHHTVTADDDSFNSDFVEPGQSYSRTFLKPGRYPYHCVLHGSEGGAGMAGVIIVVAASRNI